jgi:hypothetical protein
VEGEGEVIPENRTIIIDRDTCTMVLSDAEFTADRVRLCVDAIAAAIETALEADGVENIEVVREYRTTGRRSTAEGLEQLLEKILVGQVDDIREAVLTDREET